MYWWGDHVFHFAMLHCYISCCECNQSEQILLGYCCYTAGGTFSFLLNSIKNTHNAGKTFFVYYTRCLRTVVHWLGGWIFGLIQYNCNVRLKRRSIASSPRVCCIHETHSKLILLAYSYSDSWVTRSSRFLLCDPPATWELCRFYCTCIVKAG